jgi:hypothetical protein
MDFEKTFDRYARTQDPTDLRNCIHMASNYVEGLASVSAGIPAVGNTLGRLVGSLPYGQRATFRQEYKEGEPKAALTSLD